MLRAWVASLMSVTSALKIKIYSNILNIQVSPIYTLSEKVNLVRSAVASCKRSWEFGWKGGVMQFCLLSLWILPLPPHCVVTAHISAAGIQTLWILTQHHYWWSTWMAPGHIKVSARGNPNSDSNWKLELKFKIFIWQGLWFRFSQKPV